MSKLLMADILADLQKVRLIHKTRKTSHRFYSISIDTVYLIEECSETYIAYEIRSIDRYFDLIKVEVGECGF
jgi:hypothetical protein